MSKAIKPQGFTRNSTQADENELQVPGEGPPRGDPEKARERAVYHRHSELESTGLQTRRKTWAR